MRAVDWAVDRLPRRLPDRAGVRVGHSGLRHIPALEASLILLIEPVLNPVWAWLFQGERPAPGRCWAARSFWAPRRSRDGWMRARSARWCRRWSWRSSPAGSPPPDAAREREPDPDGTLIETVRIRNGAAPLWYLHLRRLAGSCKALGVPLPGELLTPKAAPTGCTGCRWASAGRGGRAAGRVHRSGAADHVAGGPPAVSSQVGGPRAVRPRAGGGEGRAGRTTGCC